MKQLLFRIPGLGIPVYGFGLLVVIGFYVGLFVAVRRSRRERLDPEVVYELAVWMLVGGMVGARLFYVVEYWGEKIHTIGQALKVWEGGIVYYGGFVGGLGALFLYRAFRPFPLLPTLDAIAPSIAIGTALGRVGCFLNGCCYGDLCDISWLAVRFPAGSPPWLAERTQGLIASDATRSLPLHPTQLYSVVDGLILFALLTAYYPIRRRDGEVMSLFLITYPVTRFLIERLRDDEAALASGFTIAQTVSLFVVAAGLTFWSWLSARPEKRWADAPEVAVAEPES
jgi:phosphatidylglycerol:prolipoprotein diacylglycerol transferase